MGAGEPPPPGRPHRALDTVTIEGLEDLFDPNPHIRSSVKSRELDDLEVRSPDVKVVLFDVYSVDSFAACLVARKALGGNARYEAVDRSMVMEDLAVDVCGQVVIMLGLCWSLEAMHDLVAECDWLLIFETNTSSTRELGQFIYPNAIRILEPDMGAGALAYNFFFPGKPVPALLRALEDAELGRNAMQDGPAFEDGFSSTFDLMPARGELLCDDTAFDELELLCFEDGRGTIATAIDKGMTVRPGILAQCHEATKQHKVQTMRAFPAWRCLAVNMTSDFAGRIGEHLVASLHAEGPDGQRTAARSFAAVFEVKRQRVRVVLRSTPNGPDVSQIAAKYDGNGHPCRAFFSMPIAQWEELWAQTEPILWDVVPPSSSGSRCLALKRGELVIVARRGERFGDSPSDEWSWGYKSDDPTTEGWIPTLAHTLLVATRSALPGGPGILGAEAGDLLVARGQKGRFFWGVSQQQGQLPKTTQGWFPNADGVWQPVHPSSVQAWSSSHSSLRPSVSGGA